MKASDKIEHLAALLKVLRATEQSENTALLLRLASREVANLRQIVAEYEEMLARQYEPGYW